MVIKNFDCPHCKVHNSDNDLDVITLQSNSRKLFEVSLSAIQMYSKYHSDKKRNISGEEEENKFNDISIVMDLLMNLLAKDFLDFGPDGEAAVVFVVVLL